MVSVLMFSASSKNIVLIFNIPYDEVGSNAEGGSFYHIFL